MTIDGETTTRVDSNLLDLKTTLARGARYLVARQTIGVVVSLGGVLALTRLLGPSRYGLYAAAFGLFATWQTAAELSLDVYLVRRPEPNDKSIYDQIFTLLLILGIITTPIGLGLLVLVEHYSHLHRLFAVGAVMFALLPVIHLSQVPLSKLERELDYKHVGFTETVAQIAFFVVALPLAAAGAGVWAAVAGFWTQQVALVALFFAFGGYRPGLRWDRAQIRDAFDFGIACTGATWSYSARNLASPILVARLLGPQGVAFVALGTKLIDQLSFLRLVTFRMSLAVLVRLRDHRDVMRRAMSDGMLAQLAIAGVPFWIFSLLSEVMIPIVFGDKWKPAARLFAAIAPAFLAYITFNLHLASLMSRPRPWILVWVNGLNTLLLWGGVAVFVPAFGLQGYGAAELLTVVSYVAMDRAYRRDAPAPDYRLPIIWWAALSLGIAAPLLHWVTAPLPVLVLALPESRRRIAAIRDEFRSTKAPVEIATA
jgi:PST family polysaccharide transporter